MVCHINSAFKTVTEDFVPVTPANDFAVSLAPSIVPDRYVVSVAEAGKQLHRSAPRKP